MKIKVGKSYKVIKNRESHFGRMGDIERIEGEKVKVIHDFLDGDFRISDEKGNTHVCQSCNLKEVEQLNDNIKESVVVGKGFKIGDSVRIINKDGMLSTVGEVDLGDTAVIEKYNNVHNDYKLRFDVSNDYWFAKDGEFELIKSAKDIKVVEKKKEFVAGDKVRVVKEPGHCANIGIGDTAVFQRIRNGGKNCEIQVDKTGNYQTVYKSSLESITDKDVQKLKIITEGTTTTVLFKDGREGVARLYYKDKYNKGFGLIQALSKALDIDLVEEVLKVVKSYEVEDKPTKEEIKEFADRTAFKLRAFKVGDLVKGVEDSIYGITDQDMTKGEIIKVLENKNVKVKILEHKHEGDIGREFVVNPKYLKMNEAAMSVKIGGHIVKGLIAGAIEETPKFKIGDIVKGTEAGNKPYLLTNVKMTKGEIVEIEDSEISVKVLAHEDGYSIGTIHTVDPKYFELVKKTPKFEIGCKVKIPKTKQGREVNGQSYSINAAKEKHQDYLFLLRIHEGSRKNTYVLSENKAGIGDYFNIEDLELYEESKFKVGDIVKGTKAGNKPYAYTNERMLEAEVIKVNSDESRMDIKIKEYKGERDFISLEFSNLETKYFELVERPSDKKSVLLDEPKLNVKFKEGDSVRLIKELGGTDGKTKVRDTARIKSVGHDDYLITMDKDGHDWFAYGNRLEVYIPEVKTFKVGDFVRIRKDLIVDNRYNRMILHDFMNKYKGKAAEITSINTDGSFRLSGLSYSWAPDMLERAYVGYASGTGIDNKDIFHPQGETGKEIVFKETTKAEFKKDDKVRMISKTPTYSFGGVKTGDIGVVRGTSPRSTRLFVDFPNQSYWSADPSDLELIEEPKYRIGQTITQEEAIQIVKDRGRIRVSYREPDEEYAEYFLKGSELWVEFDGGNSFSSGGYENIEMGEKYSIVKLPVVASSK